MESTDINIQDVGTLTEGKCSNDSFYVRFTDDDVEELSQYCFDLGYELEPEIMDIDPEHPVRFKITSKENPKVYGWISKVVEKFEDHWRDAFLYGFYRKGKFFNKYPVSFNVNSRQMRGMMKRNAEKNPQQTTYFKTIFGIMDLELDVNAMDFIFSWLWSVKFQHI
ncbi:MAG: hypothetical protein NT040_04420 [Bacteroidetes bacterium]|nr:hypothetical protein [Bacteroidota bacterium]